MSAYPSTMLYPPVGEDDKILLQGAICTVKGVSLSDNNGLFVPLIYRRSLFFYGALVLTKKVVDYPFGDHMGLVVAAAVDWSALLK